MKLRSLLVIAALAAPLTLMAQQQEPESPWSGSATLGYLATSGNTETSTLNTGLEVGYTTGKWEHVFDASAVNASENDVKTAESYAANWKSELNITDHDFLFGRLSWRKNLFGGFNTQFSQTVGYGRRLIDVDKHKPQKHDYCAATFRDSFKTALIQLAHVFNSLTSVSL